MFIFKSDSENHRLSRDAWQMEHQDLLAKHENLKREHDSVQMQALELEEENKALRAQLEKVKAVFGIQPRDVSTGQWQSPAIVNEPSAEQKDESPRTGTDPFWR